MSAIIYLALAACATAITTLVGVAPVVLAAVAGVALLPTLASSLVGAVRAEGERIPAVVTFLVAASGLTAWGIGAAFWALLAGLAVHLALRARL